MILTRVSIIDAGVVKSPIYCVVAVFQTFNIRLVYETFNLAIQILFKECVIDVNIIKRRPLFPRSEP